jgi:hypothetical protein
VIQKKTGPVRFEVTGIARSAIEEWLSNIGGRKSQYLFPNRFRKQLHLSIRQYPRIGLRWADRAGLDGSGYAMRSMRRTKPAQIYKKTGSLRGRTAPPRTYEARKHRPLSRHRKSTTPSASRSRLSSEPPAAALPSGRAATTRAAYSQRCTRAGVSDGKCAVE